MTYYEDPRRFSSRVIGFSFQGPRGRTFLPSGSRCLVSLAFAVKDFLKLSFHRGCFGLFFPALLERRSRASGLRSGSRYLVFIVLAVKDFVNFFLRPPFANFSCAGPCGSASVGSEAGGGVCSRSGPLGKYFCHYLSYSEKPRNFDGFRIKKTLLLSSDRAAGPDSIR